MRLVPTDPAVVPLTLIDANATVDDLVAQAIQNRPDLAANRELLAAALETARRQKYAPLIPKLGVSEQVGNFGGGLGNDLRNFAARNVLGVQVTWGAAIPSRYPFGRSFRCFAHLHRGPVAAAMRVVLVCRIGMPELR